MLGSQYCGALCFSCLIFYVNIQTLIQMGKFVPPLYCIKAIRLKEIILLQMQNSLLLLVV